MKFQIITYRVSHSEAIASGKPFVAMCKPFPWLSGHPLMRSGETREAAIEGVTRIIQDQFDALYPEMQVDEIELQLSDKARKLEPPAIGWGG
jgi:hypothetical protein